MEEDAKSRVSEAAGARKQQDRHNIQKGTKAKKNANKNAKNAEKLTKT